MALEKIIVVIGSGPGIGVSTASLFAARKFKKVALIARNPSRLAQDREAVLAAARKYGKEVDVGTWSCDITDTPRFDEVLKAVETIGTVSCMLYNAAEVVPSELFTFPEEDIIRHFKVIFSSDNMTRE
jgi:NAD(P)-dependent dehydrogenase (short-subunit alcohol dehydrogenase family)